MNFKPFKSILSLLIICVISVFTFSCGDDDDVNCDKAMDDIIQAFESYDNALENNDCEDLDDLFNDAVKAIRKGKSCPEVKEGVEDEGFDNVEDFIDLLEEEHAEEVENCGAPA